jgi:hypothetical protein
MYMVITSICLLVLAANYKLIQWQQYEKRK